MSLVSIFAGVLMACVVLVVNASTATATLRIPMDAISINGEDEGICGTAITAGHAVFVPT